MKIGITKEIKAGETRVAMTPAGVKVLLDSAPDEHRVFIEKDAGLTAGFDNAEYENAGAIVLPSASQVYNEATLIVHVKEPLPKEYCDLREDHILFTYLHLAA